MSLQTQLAIKDEHWEEWEIQDVLPLFPILCPGYSDQVSHVSLMYWHDEKGHFYNPIVKAIFDSLDIQDRIEILQYISEE